MTTERRRPAKLPAWPVAAGTAGTFLAALAFLAGQVRDGRDAALGPAEPVAATRAPREVVVRRIIRRVVITHPAPRAAAPAAGGAAPAAAQRAAPRPPSAPAPAAAAPGSRPGRSGARARPADHPLLVTAVAGGSTSSRSPRWARPSGCSPRTRRRSHAARAEVERLAARLTRFDARSELCALNADPRAVVPASADLRAAVRAALRGAELTGGLADPTLLGALERAGYARSLDRRAAHAAAPARSPPRPPRRPARPHPAAALAARARRRRGRHDRPPARRSGWTSAAAPRASSPTAPRPCSRRRAVRRRLRRRHARRTAPTRCSSRIRSAANRRPRSRSRDGAVATSGVDARLWGARRATTCSTRPRARPRGPASSPRRRSRRRPPRPRRSRRPRCWPARAPAARCSPATAARARARRRHRARRRGREAAA